MRKEVIISLLKQVLLVALVAYGFIVLAVYAIPHLPLANRSTFPVMLHMQVTLDREKDAAAAGETKGYLLFLGSSVVERGVDDLYLDSAFSKQHIPFYTTNSGAGGYFAKANLKMFRSMLEHGLRPARVVYGIFLQELNGKSLIHNDLDGDDSSILQYKAKNLLNVMRYGATALSPMLDGNNVHIYLFLMNNAFRDVRNPNFFQRLSFGENMYERDSNYTLNPEYLKDLKEIYYLCKERNIPFAFFNTPVRSEMESLADLPYLHKYEAYHAVEQFAVEENIPIWNFDMAGLFDDKVFQDTYHLTAEGARGLTEMLEAKIIAWQNGRIEQDLTALPNGVRNEIKDSLIRTVFHF